MNISSTLGKYLARNYAVNLFFMLCILLGIIYLFDTVELLRRAGKKEGVPLALVLQMGLLKLPEVGQMVFPFAVLFSAIFTFWQLTRRHELIIVRASGFSIWQLLSPILSVAIGFGVFQITIINPVSAMLLNKFEQLENSYLVNSASHHVALFDEGLWLRQSGPEEKGYFIFHAENVEMPEWQLKKTTGLYFDDQDNFIYRLDSPTAILKKGMWYFHDATINKPSKEMEQASVYSLSTNLTPQEIEESFASPETISIWKLPSFIKVIESTGFDSTRLKIHFQSLLSHPLLYASMILLAASVSMRSTRSKGTLAMIVAGVFIGFVVFFMISFLKALGVSHQIPIFLAAWSPALVTLLFGLAVILNLEDG
jgi:lipopolysaccharide export system permease protein